MAANRIIQLNCNAILKDEDNPVKQIYDFTILLDQLTRTFCNIVLRIVIDPSNRGLIRPDP